MSLADDKKRVPVVSRVIFIPALLALSLPVLHMSTNPLAIFPCSNVNDEHVQPLGTVHISETVQKSERVHILYALSGNATGFLSEFEISMKSVLMNSPIDFDMTIHVMADQEAYQALPDVLNRTGISTWKTRNQINVVVYNIESKIEAWKEFIQQTMGYATSILIETHTIGTFFRLFVQQVVDQHLVRHMIYMDTDVIVMSSIEALWNLRDDTAYFQFGTLECAGLLLLNVAKLDLLWKVIDSKRPDLKRLSHEIKQTPNDQLVVRVVKMTHPKVVSLLPPEWDIHTAALWRGSLFDLRPKGVGFLHFNGGGGSNDNTFESSLFLNHAMEAKGWTMANYFIKIPWSWAKFHVENMAKTSDDGKPLVVEWKIIPI